MRIRDIRSPELFERLVHRLFVAERGADFQVPDDSGGDRGNDGYDASRGILYSIYCPEKPDTADYRRKAKGDLAKAYSLSKQPGYMITDWVFVTPTGLREPLQAELRAEAKQHGVAASFLADLHLDDLYRRHVHLRGEFPELEYPEVAQDIQRILELLANKPDQPSNPPTAARGTEDSQVPLSGGAMVGIITPRLEQLYLAAQTGDISALAGLERYRMEALDTRDFLDALILSMDLAGERQENVQALRLAEQGLARARSSGMTAETAVLAANAAFFKALELVSLEMEYEANLHFTRMAGVPFQTVEEIERAERPIVLARAEIQSLLDEARAAALKSNNLLAIHTTMLRQAMATTQRMWAVDLRLRVQGDEPTRRQLQQLRVHMQSSYEAAIRAARAMNSDARLAIAYGNFANDLRSFGDEDAAREHGMHALELAKRSGYQEQIDKTTRLLTKLSTSS